MEQQGRLFEVCQSEFGVDAFDFIEKFMLSSWAEGFASEGELSEDELLARTKAWLSTVTVLPMVQSKATAELHWVGYMYRHWAYLGSACADIIRVAPVAKCCALFPKLHCGCPHSAIKQLYDTRGESVDLPTVVPQPLSCALLDRDIGVVDCWNIQQVRSGFLTAENAEPFSVERATQVCEFCEHRQGF
jgi:hypothetical protein